ncbi:MAG TPA: hypothetical protein VLX09_25875 [Stellaceae bacterium]|nr:hypothetical protein [Stellaceae bacterium]
MMTGPNARRLLARILATAHVITPEGAPHLLIEADADLLDVLEAFDAELEDLEPSLGAVEVAIAGVPPVGSLVARCDDPPDLVDGGTLDREHDDTDDEPSSGRGTP